VDENTLEITELPVRKWTQDYKEFLETLIKPEDKAAVPILADYKENHTDKSVHFTLQLAEGKMKDVLDAGLETKFKLTTKMSTGRLVVSLGTAVCAVQQGPLG
jgi:DNA topoisomerase II